MIQLFRVFIPSTILGLLASEILLIAGCYLAALCWQVEAPVFYLLYEGGVERVAFATVSLLAGLYLNDCYQRVRMQSQLVFLQQLCLVIGAAFLFQAVISYGRLEVQMPRQAMLGGSLLCLLVLPSWRMVYSKVSLQVLGAERLLFVGTHPLQLQIADYLRANPEFAMKPVGFVTEDETSKAGGHEILGVISGISAFMGKRLCDRVVIGVSDDASAETAQTIIELQQAGHRTESMNHLYEALFGRTPISRLHAMDVVYTEGLSPGKGMLALQSSFSWGAAFAGLVITAPVMLLTAVAVRVSSPGPILFRQVRAGRNNVPFVLYKFRSMRTDAEAETGAVWAQENDPRVTPVGRVLRKYRLDELPQLLNVLRGEMSLVGPRPERPEFVKVLARQIPFYMQRLAVRPGITGWAQINYRYGNTMEDTVVKLEYDLYYIKNLSLQLDLYIMFHTVKTMLLTRGAY